MLPPRRSPRPGGLGHQRTVELQFSFEDGIDVFEGHKVNFAAFVWAANLGQDLIQVTMRTTDGHCHGDRA